MGQELVDRGLKRIPHPPPPTSTCTPIPALTHSSAERPSATNQAIASRHTWESTGSKGKHARGAVV